MVLSERLQLIYAKIPPCDILCDIGTDHGLIPAYALLNGRCKRAIACDVKKGPLERAKRTVYRFELEDRMALRLGSGLEPIAPEEADVLVLAGMGGVLMTELLAEGLEKARKARRIILQPMYAQEVVRPFLWANGFSVEDEALTREGDKLYQVLAVHSGPDPGSSRTALHSVIGEKLIQKKDPHLADWLADRIKRQQKIVQGLSRALEPKTSLTAEKELLDAMINILVQIRASDLE